MFSYQYITLTKYNPQREWGSFPPRSTCRKQKTTHPQNLRCEWVFFLLNSIQASASAVHPPKRIAPCGRFPYDIFRFPFVISDDMRVRNDTLQ